MTKKPNGWYKKITIRPTVHIDGYTSYEKMCGHVADIYFSVDEESLERRLIFNSKESINITAYTLLKVGKAKCPAYWVGSDLLIALMQSDLNVEAESLQWSMDTGFFMLPNSVVKSPENRSVNAIFWHCDTPNDHLYWTAVDGSSFLCRRLKISDQLKHFRYTDVEDFHPQLLEEFNEYLQAIFLRLILLMECRPELVDTDSRLVRINKGFGKAQAQDLYEPLWVGKNYHFKREEAQNRGGTHTSPRVHWRRGFLRNQPYGQGRQQRKIVWVEPVLVMGTQK